MTGKERLEAAFRGEPVDRAPVWLREGFELLNPIPEADHFTLGWKDTKVYRELYEYVFPYIDFLVKWGIGGLFNRFMMIPPKYIYRQRGKLGDVERIYGYLETPKERLEFIEEVKRGVATSWHIKPVASSIEDLKKIAEIPFDIDMEVIASNLNDYTNITNALEDKGLENKAIIRFDISSPIVAISHCLTLDLFLELSITEKSFFHELLQEITRRTLAIIDVLFKDNDIDTIVNLGGSEQCTPPLMSPYAFDEFVVPYDGQIVKRLKGYGIIVNNHCHSKVKHALKCMIDMGLDSTDPIEPPPQGDVMYAQAREIAGDKLTLIGNLEWTEITKSEPAHIRERIKEILSYGNNRLILGASAGPISAIDEVIAENYRTWIETVLEFS